MLGLVLGLAALRATVCESGADLLFVVKERHIHSDREIRNPQSAKNVLRSL
jgi:hypothetical protein